MPKQTHRRLSPRKQRLLHPPKFANTRYVDIQKHWRRLKPLFNSSQAYRIWKPCMEENRQWHAEDHGFKYIPHPEYKLPSEYDSCDWRWPLDKPRKGPMPSFWDFVCHAACHWLVDLNLYVACNAYPNEPWRILTVSTGKNNHSTVWNGDLDSPLLFDANFLALGISPIEALKITWRGRELSIGEYLKGYLHQQGFSA